MWDRAIAALGLVVGVAAMAGAQERIGPEFRLNAYTTSFQHRPSVAADADGNFVVAWFSYAQDGHLRAVVARRYDRLGQARGGEFVVNEYTQGSQGDPSVSVDPAGGFVVAWASANQDGSAYGVFARRFDPAGAALGIAEFRVNTYTTSSQGYPDVAHTTGGNFVVVWVSSDQDGSNSGVFGRRFDSAGAAVGPEFRVNAYTTGAQANAAVTATAAGGFVVTWSSPHDGGAYGVFARRFDASGAPLGVEFQVNSWTTGAQDSPDVAAGPSGGFVVVWNSLAQDDPFSNGVFGRRYDAAGNPLGAEFRLNTYTTGGQQHPSIAHDPTGAFVVTWDGVHPQDGLGYGVAAQRFDAGAARIGGAVLVNTFTTQHQTYPAVASLGVERFVVTWASATQDGSSYGVFGQRFGDYIFRDGFETSDVSRWSAAASDGGDLGVTVGAAMKFTAFGMQAFVDDTNGVYVQDDTPRDETIYRARFYFHPGDFDPGEAQQHLRTRIFIAFEEAPTRRLFALVLRRREGEYALMGRARRDDNTQANTVFVPITADEHFVELRWARATAVGSNNGSLEVWIDGVLQASNTGLDNDLSTIDFVRMGALSVKTGAAGTLYFDEFESRRETQIGP